VAFSTGHFRAFQAVAHKQKKNLKECLENAQESQIKTPELNCSNRMLMEDSDVLKMRSKHPERIPDEEKKKRSQKTAESNQEETALKLL